MRNLFLFTPKRRLPIFARNFLAFLDGDLAQKSISGLGFVGQDLIQLSFSKQQDRLANAIQASGEDVKLNSLKSFVRTFSAANRLSATFRFNDNSIVMDTRSKRNIANLARMIEVGDFDGRQIIFAGFSDSQGGGPGNRRISRQRAEQVATAVKTAASRADLSKIKIRVHGMGEVSPLACNDTELGRHTNRRVEVWLK